MDRLITIITDSGLEMQVGPDANEVIKTIQHTRRKALMQEISDKIGDNQYARMKTTCIDCQEEFVMNFERIAEDQIEIKNGAIGKRYGNYVCKCPACFEKNDYFGTHTEVYSRVVGYLRPISSWNQAKKNEFHDRKMYKMD